jgi:hypothetical protein
MREDLLIIVVIIVLIVFSGPIYMYIRARQVVSVDVQALSLNEILEIGTKTSIPALRSVERNVQVFTDPKLPGVVGWNARNGHVICSYYAVPLTDGTGFRVAATARPQALGRTFSMRGLEQAMSSRRPNGGSEYLGGVVGSWLGQKIWLWSHARKVLFRRMRTFSALKRADQGKLAVLAPQAAAVAGLSPESGAGANGA